MAGYENNKLRSADPLWAIPCLHPKVEKRRFRAQYSSLPSLNGTDKLVCSFDTCEMLVDHRSVMKHELLRYGQGGQLIG